MSISVFCYKLWELIKYLDPSCQFPECKWQNGCFMGIAWDHGNPFTYLVWTDPDEGGCQKGTELVYNAVWPQKNANTTDKKERCSKAETAKLNKK
eukprot:187536-Ditylum_brightwellii.AAC.1